MSIFIVAEIGINHNGDMSICKELIDVAADSGCDAVICFATSASCISVNGPPAKAGGLNYG